METILRSLLALAAAIGAATLTGCAPMSTPSETKTIDRAFTVESGNTRSGNTSLHIAVYAEEREGRTLVCAAAAARGEKSFEGEWPQALLNRTRVYIGEEQILPRAPFGATYPGEDVLVGKSANCVVADVAWRSSFDNRKARLRVGAITLKQ